MNKLIMILLTSFLFLAMGCTEVQDSAGKALDNAGSVVKTGNNKAWGRPDTAEPAFEVAPTPNPRY